MQIRMASGGWDLIWAVKEIGKERHRGHFRLVEVSQQSHREGNLHSMEEAEEAKEKKMLRVPSSCDSLSRQSD